LNYAQWRNIQVHQGLAKLLHGINFVTGSTVTEEYYAE
jgi:hypothetical protein